MRNILKKWNYLFWFMLRLKDFNWKIQYAGLDGNEQNLLRQLEENGVAVIPNYFSPQECKEMRQEIDKYENIAMVYDNDKRIWGINKFSRIFNEKFSKNKLFKKIGEHYENDELILETTMAAKLYYKPGNLGSGGGWHRDSYSRQYKAIAYLSDVTEKNGPFQYITNSHKLENIKREILKFKRKKIIANYPRFSEEDIERYIKEFNAKIMTYTGTAGTVLLVDVRGIHRGKPIEEGIRYSVFNYYLSKTYYSRSNEIEKLANEVFKKYKEHFID